MGWGRLGPPDRVFARPEDDENIGLGARLRGQRPPSRFRVFPCLPWLSSFPYFQAP